MSSRCVFLLWWFRRCLLTYVELLAAARGRILVLAIRHALQLDRGSVSASRAGGQRGWSALGCVFELDVLNLARE